MRLALAAILCGGAIALIARPTCASAASHWKKEPVFEEIPGITTPAPIIVAQAAAVAPTNSPPEAAAPPQTPVPPPTKAQPATNAPPAEPPLTDQTQGKMLYAFTATDLDLRTALATFARANGLNIVPDNNIAGTVTVDVRDLPLEQMMRALLEASDC